MQRQENGEEREELGEFNKRSSASEVGDEVKTDRPICKRAPPAFPLPPPPHLPPPVNWGERCSLRDSPSAQVGE